MRVHLKLLALTTCLLSPVAGAASLVYGAGGEPVSLDPGTITDTNSALVQMNVYDTLVRLKKGGSDLVPGLALQWKPNADATEWTFFLRPGVKFHDGTPADASAVVFNLKRWWDKDAESGVKDTGKTFTSWQFFVGAYKGEKNTLIKDIRAEGAGKVVVSLTRPFVPLPETLATSVFGIASPTAIKKAGAKYGTPAALPVGTGPFVMQSWNTGDRIVMTPNKNYWGKKASYDQLIFRFFKDPSARLNELKAAGIDFTSDLNPEQLKAVKADSNLQAILVPSFNVGYVAMNTRNQYLKNDKVRKAISMAINKQAIADAFWDGLAVSDASFIPPALGWANSKNLPKDYKFDPKAAKALLAEAGYPNGFSIDLWYMPVSRPYFPTPKPIAEAMAADLGAIGIKVNLKTEDWAKYIADQQKGALDMFMLGWTGPFASPYIFYNPHFSDEGNVDTSYANQTLFDLLKAAPAATSRAAQTKVYQQISEIVYNANIRLPMVHTKPLAAARTYVKGWVPGPSLLTPFEDITIDDKK